MDILDKAIVFATEKHSGAHRKGTMIPYIVHPMEACAIAATMTTDREVLAAAVLHDTVEDTDATAEEIERRFGEKVKSLVCADSEDKKEGLPSCDTWELRKQETLNFICRATQDEQIIILSDKLSNIRAIHRDYAVLGDKLWERFNQKDKKKHCWYYCEVQKRLTLVCETVAYKEYARLVKDVFADTEGYDFDR